MTGEGVVAEVENGELAVLGEVRWQRSIEAVVGEIEVVQAEKLGCGGREGAHQFVPAQVDEL